MVTPFSQAPRATSFSSTGLEKLKALNTLVLSHNDVASMGTWLAGATALVKLSLSHNSIGEIGAALK